ncbi:hypothetical protein NPIL_216131 [Nephila pilipes]|uniref:Uncharacterized protein n=1 Tax=Nephila pilipes TaxID=299642 RepID=A0A8X6TH99_NEPPI|nr:hypothetical protein NPIL_216131 [Nephila pilipes]
MKWKYFFTLRRQGCLSLGAHPQQPGIGKDNVLDALLFSEYSVTMAPFHWILVGEATQFQMSFFPASGRSLPLENSSRSHVMKSKRVFLFDPVTSRIIGPPPEIHSFAFISVSPAGKRDPASSD